MNCNCICHKKGYSVMHVIPCCDRCYETFLDEEGKPLSEGETSCEKIQDHGYSPLPEYLRIDKSSIHGQGLFTNISLVSGDILGISHIPAPFTLEGRFHMNLIRTPLGGFINHCDTPTAKLLKSQTDGCYYLVVATRIEEDEEITLNYHKEICGIDG